MAAEKDSAKKLEESKKRQNQLDEYLNNNPKSIPGEMVQGTIEDVVGENVVVFVPGVKKEIEMSVSDFDEPPQKGDKVEALLRTDSKGKYLLSKKKFYNNSSDSNGFKEAQENKTPVPGEIVKVVKTKVVKEDGGEEEEKYSGYEVKLSDEYYGFCPLSKADVEHIAKPESLIGLKDYFIIEKFHSNPRYKSVVNRREFLQMQIDANKKEFFDSVAVGDVVEGTVKSITNFGVFVNLGGFDGLLHVNDISWGHVSKTKNFVKKGDVLRLRVLSFDKEASKINLSLKDMQENPWLTFADRYSVGQVIKGTVVRVTNFGIFVEIEPGIEGLVHVSELSWSRKTFNPAEIYHVKDVVEAKILGYDLDQERISLGIRQLVENPWDTLAEKYPVGTKMTSKAVKVTQIGAFFKIDDDIDGFLSVDDVSWTEKITNMKNWIKEGDEKEFVISYIDSKSQRIRLSVKALSENPWQTFANAYPKGSTVKGQIVSINEKGANVKLNDDVQTFVNKYNLDVRDSEKVEDKFKEGDEISAIVTDINPKMRKIIISCREQASKEIAVDYEKYMSSSSDESEGSGYTLGDILTKDDKKDE